MGMHRKRLLVAAFVAGIAASAPALDIGIEGWAGNLAFRTDRAPTDKSFPGADYPWGVSGYAVQSLADNVGFEAGFFSDPVMRNISYTLFSYSEKILTIGVGPFFGFFNDW